MPSTSSWINVNADNFKARMRRISAEGKSLSKPLNSTRGLEAIRILRMGTRGIRAQFADQTEYRGKNVIPWAKTKPFGNKPAPKKTLHGSGGYRSAFLGGAGAIQRITANSVEVGVDPVQFPMVKIHQGRYASRRVKPKEKVKKLGPNYGQWTMRWFLGLTYGVWIKNSKLSKGVLIPRRRVSLAAATKKEISTYLARDIKARIRGGASL
jgi:hypothetical protein